MEPEEDSYWYDGYNYTWLGLNGWTYAQKQVLEAEIMARGRRRDLEAAIEENRRRAAKPEPVEEEEKQPQKKKKKAFSRTGSVKSLAIVPEADGIVITIESVAHLPKMDIFGSCDPYFKLLYKTRVEKTSIKKSTFQSVWREDFTFKLIDGPHDSVGDLEIIAYDWDMIGSHDIIGNIVISSEELMRILSEGVGFTYSHSTELFNPKGEVIYGKDGHKTVLDYSLRVLNTTEVKDDASIDLESSVGSFKKQKLSVMLNEIAVKHLPKMDFFGSCDPYIWVIHKGFKSKKTKIRKNVYNAAWQQEFKFPVPGVKPNRVPGTKAEEDKEYPGVEEGDMYFICYDWDRMAKDEIVGTAIIKKADLKQMIIEGEGFETTRQLKLVDDKGGQVQGKDGLDTVIEVKLKVIPREKEKDTRRLDMLRGLASSSEDDEDDHFNDDDDEEVIAAKKAAVAEQKAQEAKRGVIRINSISVSSLPKMDTIGWCDPFFVFSHKGVEKQTPVKKNVRAAQWGPEELKGLEFQLAKNQKVGQPGPLDMEIKCMDWERFIKPRRVGVMSLKQRFLHEFATNEVGFKKVEKSNLFDPKKAIPCKSKEGTETTVEIEFEVVESGPGDAVEDDAVEDDYDDEFEEEEATVSGQKEEKTPILPDADAKAVQETKCDEDYDNDGFEAEAADEERYSEERFEDPQDAPKATGAKSELESRNGSGSSDSEAVSGAKGSQSGSFHEEEVLSEGAPDKPKEEVETAAFEEEALSDSSGPKAAGGKGPGSDAGSFHEEVLDDDGDPAGHKSGHSESFAGEESLGSGPEVQAKKEDKEAEDSADADYDDEFDDDYDEEFEDEAPAARPPEVADAFMISNIVVTHLPKMDTFGKCDPYITVIYKGKRLETSVEKNTFDAKWATDFTFSLVGDEVFGDEWHETQAKDELSHIEIRCMDWNSMFSHALVGRSIVSKERLGEFIDVGAGYEETMVLDLQTKDGKPVEGHMRGETRVEIKIKAVRTGKYHDEEGSAAEAEAELQKYLKKKDAEAMAKRKKTAAQQKKEKQKEVERKQITISEAEKERFEFLRHRNPFYQGGLLWAAEKVKKESELEARKIEEGAAHEEEGAERKNWVAATERSHWGIGEQGDRLDNEGHRGVKPFWVNFMGGFTEVYVKNLDWNVTEAHVKAVFGVHGDLSSVRLSRDEDADWRLEPFHGLRKCSAFLSFKSDKAAKAVVFSFDGRTITLAPSHIKVGDQEIPRQTQMQEQAGGQHGKSKPESGEELNEAYVRGSPHYLALVQLFWAVRDGDVTAAAAAGASGLDINTPIRPKEFPEPEFELKGLGRTWPTRGFDGRTGDTALHLASRYLHSAMVSKLLEMGANVLATNSKGDTPIDCVGVIEKKQEDEAEDIKPPEQSQHSAEQEDEKDLPPPKRKTIFYDSDDESDTEQENSTFTGFGGTNEEETFAAREAVIARLKQAQTANGNEGDQAGEILVSRRAYVMPAVSVEQLDDPAGLGREIWDTKGFLKINKEDFETREPPKVWVGGSRRKIQSRFKKHERSNARFHGAGVAGETVFGLNMPGPGYNWDKVMTAWDSTKRSTTRAMRFTNKRAGAKAPREPEGFSLGGRYPENRAAHMERMWKSGKGQETKLAQQSKHGPIEMRAPHIGFPSKSRDIREGATRGADALDPMSRRAGGAIGGVFSNAPGTGHMAYSLHAEGDDLRPGPASYAPQLETTARPISWGHSKRRLTGEADDTPAFDPKTGKYYMWIYRKMPSLDTAAPGPGAYNTTDGRPLREGMQGFSFPMDEYASRFMATEGASSNLTPGPNQYQAILNPLGPLGMGGPNAGYTFEKAEKVGLGLGTEDTPGPTTYRPDGLVVKHSAPSYSVPLEGSRPFSHSNLALSGMSLSAADHQSHHHLWAQRVYGAEMLNVEGVETEGLNGESPRSSGAGIMHDQRISSSGVERLSGLEPGSAELGGLAALEVSAVELDDSLDRGWGAEELVGRVAEGWRSSQHSAAASDRPHRLSTQHPESSAAQHSALSTSALNRGAGESLTSASAPLGSSQTQPVNPLASGRQRRYNRPQR